MESINLERYIDRSSDECSSNDNIPIEVQTLSDYDKHEHLLPPSYSFVMQGENKKLPPAYSAAVLNDDTNKEFSDCNESKAKSIWDKVWDDIYKIEDEQGPLTFDQKAQILKDSTRGTEAEQICFNYLYKKPSAGCVNIDNSQSDFYKDIILHSSNLSVASTSIDPTLNKAEDSIVEIIEVSKTSKFGQIKIITTVVLSVTFIGFILFGVCTASPLIAGIFAILLLSTIIIYALTVLYNEISNWYY